MTKISKFANLPGVRLLKERMRKTLQSNGMIPFFLPHQGVSGASIEVGGRTLINYSGYNYLGLAGHPEVVSEAKRAIDRFGTTVSASRIVSGEIPLHRELERELADFLGAEDCLVYVSGYNTNVTTIGHLYGHRDLILHDDQSHNSLLNGCLLARARRHGYEHNNLDQLEHLLKRERAASKRALVVAEGVYSMSGDFPDLKRLSELCVQFDAELLLDEAHSVGTLGPTGRGLTEHFGLPQSTIDIQIGTLSKALSSCGGFVAGDGTLIEYLRYSAPGFIYSVGLPPSETAAALAALRILRREPERVALFVGDFACRGVRRFLLPAAAGCHAGGQQHEGEPDQEPAPVALGRLTSRLPVSGLPRRSASPGIGLVRHVVDRRAKTGVCVRTRQ